MANDLRSSIRPSHLTLGAWLRFEDRNAHFDESASTLITNRRTSARIGDWDDIGWEREDWEIQAVLVSLGDGATDSLQSLTPHELYHASRTPFDLGWQGDDFSFAGSESAYGLVIHPWVTAWTHPITGDFHLDANDDFIRYHVLEQRGTTNDREYVHPLERLLVSRIAITRPAPFENPAAYVEVQRDYLRDFLAARGAAMLINVIGDRFVVCDNASTLEIADGNEYKIGPGTSLLPVVQSTPRGNVQGRMTLYQTAIIEPYPKPRRSRTAWPYYGADDEGTPEPTFIADDGSRKTAAQIGRGYLYFQPAALERYLSAPGHSAAFHMRTWGSANGPGDSSVAIGINDKGLLTIFAPLMTKLSNIEQTHWAHYSAPPDGGPCSEWFQTQMMQDPPHSPSVPELLSGASADLNAAWIGRFGISLYKAQTAQTEELRQGDRNRMSVGPITGQFEEIPRLAKAMYEAAIETMDFGAIRKPLNAAGVTFDKQDKQLGLLRLLLTTILGIDDDNSRRLLAPLSLVNKLRVSSAHALQASAGDMLRAGGVNPTGFDPRSSWDALVDAVVASLTAIGKIVSQSRPSTS